MKALTTDVVIKNVMREKTGKIPVMGPMTGFIYNHTGFTPEECETNAEKFVTAHIEFQEKFGITGFFIGPFQGTVQCFGKGLINKHGAVSENGSGTLLSREGIKKLNKFDIDNCPQLDLFIERIEMFKKMAPDYPVLLIADNPAMSAADLMDGENYYFEMANDPEYVVEVTNMFVEPVAQCINRLVNAGVDILWLPLPTIGGTCISRESYLTFCHDSNKRFNKLIRKPGVPLMLHTCGDWNDRFDLVIDEGPDGLHTALADLRRLKKEHGHQISIMGQVPSVFTLMEKTPDEVYQEALESCRTCADGGGFILAADCGLPPATPVENVRAMISAAEDAEKELAGRC